MAGSSPLGRRLRALRQQAGLTQQEAANLAGLSVAALRDMEQGRVVAPRAQTLHRLGVVLRLSRSDTDELAQLRRHGREEPAPGWRIGVLGPLQAQVDGLEVDLGSQTQRALVGLLALSPNHPVSRDSLREIAGEARPAAGTDALSTRISRLRRRLQPRPEAAGPPLLLATEGGYQLTATEDQLDLVAFRARVRRARAKRADGELPAACELFAEAAGLWRGVPLAGLPSLANHPAVVKLIREWQSVVVEYATLALDLGRYADAVPLLQQVVEIDPLEETAHARLMLALAGTGRQASALAAFDSLRRRLADELGTAPRPELAEAHRRVLRQEVTRPEAPPVSARRQLPPDIADFTGRAEELRRLHEWLPVSVDGANAVSVATIEGMGGSGKTRLAIRLAHELLVAGQFADHQLYVDLHGRGQQPPAEPATVLASFLHLLGVPREDIPADLAGRLALYRDRLCGKNALLVLDNAASEEQLAPLLPASPTNLVLITSRRALTLDNAYALSLGAFTTQEAIELLNQTIGPERVGADPTAAQQLVGLCGKLPLAVALAARRLRARPAWTPSDLVTRLADRDNRLDELTAGTRQLRSVLEPSYRALPAFARQAYRLLGSHPDDDFTADSLADSAGSTTVAAQLALDQLAEEHLVQALPGGRYRLHELFCDHANELARTDDAGIMRSRPGADRNAGATGGGAP